MAADKTGGIRIGYIGAISTIPVENDDNGRTTQIFPWGKVDFDENAPAFVSKDG